MKQLLSKITAKDKLLHFIAGTLIYLFLALFISLEWALASTIVIAGAKEAVWDMYLKKGTPEPLDFFMTILPVILMYFIL
jgi:hypothetical protein